MHFSPSLAQLLLSSSPTYKIGFPGWPDPNLDSVPVFWGVSSKKGACTSPLFHFGQLFCHFSSWWLAGAGLQLPASVSSKSFSSEGRPVRPSFSFTALSFSLFHPSLVLGARCLYPALARD